MPLTVKTISGIGNIYFKGRLLALLHLSLESSKCVEVTERLSSSNILDACSVVLLSSTWLASWLLLLLALSLECTRVREDDTLCILNELDYLELELLTNLCFSTVFLNEVLWCSEALTTLVEKDN